MTLLGKLIPHTAAKAFGKRGFAEGNVLLHWPKIVGEHVASFCVPQKLARDRHGRGAAVLHVDVLPGFALELQQMEPVILETISTYAGYRAVERLQLHQTYYLPQSEEIPKTPPPTAAQSERAAKETESVKDEPLRNALSRLGARIHQREETLAKEKDAP